jgi:hypothetical protein
MHDLPNLPAAVSRDASVPAPEQPATVPAKPEPAPDLAAEADQYAIIYPRRAALFRAHGGMPDKITFGPPSAELVHAIVTGDSPILRALDHTQEAVTA